MKPERSSRCQRFRMMTLSNGRFCRVIGPLCGNSPVTGEFPSQRASNADFDVSLKWVRISCKTNSRMTGDLRLHYRHVTSPKWLLVAPCKVNACPLTGYIKPLSKPMLTYCQLGLRNNLNEIWINKIWKIVSTKCVCKCCLQSAGHFVQAQDWWRHQMETFST